MLRLWRRDVRAHRHIGVRMLAFFTFWGAVAPALGADQSDPSAPSAEFGANRARLIHALHNPCLKGRIVTLLHAGLSGT
jgi:hypothetical protein